ncbi:MAG TPA: hypothetical protein VL403_20855 [Candidatus Kryptonia bacterium]|nr:hypothetical protein [Candidatus Kryptonia bacterium]
MAEAESDHDLGRIGSLHAEIEALSDQLTAAVGLGGRDRRFVADGERARWAVTKRIKQAIAKIRSVHLPLARHLAASVKTGNYCSYQPDPDRPVSWVSAATAASLRRLAPVDLSHAVPHLARWHRLVEHVSFAHLHHAWVLHLSNLHIFALFARHLLG